ncbi:MAG: hypothetical protein U9O53_01875 [archaeon]|nr:hypothetical protein [archaeon]
MGSNDNIDRLKKAIGIDFDHSHAPINNPLPPQAAITQKTEPVQAKPIPNQEQSIQPKSILPPKKENPYPIPEQKSPQEHQHPIQNIPQPQAITTPNRPAPIPPKPIPVQRPAGMNNIRHIEPRKESSALFVKIDRHVEITDEIIGTRSEMKNMLDTISLLSKAEKLKSEAVGKIEKRLNLFDEKLNKIDSNLVAPKEFSSPSVVPIESKDQGLESLQSEITRLKQELNNL